MKNKNKIPKDDQAIEEENKIPQDEPDTPPVIKGRKESLYDKIPLTLKQLDIIIVFLVIALIVFLVLGALFGNGIL